MSLEKTRRKPILDRRSLRILPCTGVLLCLVCAATGRGGEQPLPAGAILRLGTTHFRHEGSVPRVLFSQDCKALLTAAGAEITFWDLDTGCKKATFRSPPSKYRVKGIVSFALSADGRLLAAASDWHLHVWDVARGTPLQTISLPPRTNVLAVAFRPDSKALAVGCADGTVLLDLESGKGIQQFDTVSLLTSLAFSPSGKMLAASARTHEVVLWDVATGEEVRRFRDTGKEFDFVTFSADGNSLAASGTYNTCVWDVATGCIRGHVNGYRSTVGSICLNADGSRLFLGGSHSDQGLQMVEVATGKEVRRYGRHIFGHYNVALSPEGKLLAAGTCFDNRPHLWEVATGKELHTDPGHQHSIHVVAFAQDGRTVISGAHDFRVWDARTGRLLHQFGDYPWSLAVSPDGKLLATGEVGQVHLWDAATLREAAVLRGSVQAPCQGLAFSPDGTRLASAGLNQQFIDLWDMKSRRALSRLGPGVVGFGRNRAEPVAFAPDGKLLAAYSGGSIRVWDAVTGQQVWEVAGFSRHLEFSPAGNVLAAEKGDTKSSEIICYQAATGRELYHLARGPKRWYYHFSPWTFSPDGRTLAAQGEDGVIRLWEVSTGKQRWQIAPRANCMAFSPDGRLLVTGNGDTTLLLWDVTGRLREGRLARLPLASPQLRALWKALAEDDAEAAYRASWTMVAGGGDTVRFLADHLPPAAKGDVAARARRIAQLIADLDDDNFRIREKATAELARLGPSARPALSKALDAKPTPEASQRLKGLLRKIKEVRQTPDQQQRERALEVLEHLGTWDARKHLKSIAEGDPGAPITQDAKASLKRLANRPATEGE